MAVRMDASPFWGIGVVGRRDGSARGWCASWWGGRPRDSRARGLRERGGSRRPEGWGAAGKDSGRPWRTLVRMSASGQSRSLFVVRRSFGRVRRGYDPVEVDRHLQLVSEWFVGSRMGERAREIEARLGARERAVAAR